MENDKVKVRSGFDFLGMVTSMMCAIHCISFPLFVLIASSIGIKFTDSEFLHIIFIVLAIISASIALPSSYKFHKKPFPLILFLIGIVTITIFEFLDSNYSKLLVVGGTFLMAFSHILNFLLSKSKNKSGHVC